MNDNHDMFCVDKIRESVAMKVNKRHDKMACECAKYLQTQGYGTITSLFKK